MTKPSLIALLLVLAGLGLGLAVMAAVWVAVSRGFGSRRLMVDDLDIDRSAKLLIDQHGEDAPTVAAMQADKWGEAGDMEGRRVRGFFFALRSRILPPMCGRYSITTAPLVI